MWCCLDLCYGYTPRVSPCIQIKAIEHLNTFLPAGTAQCGSNFVVFIPYTLPPIVFV